MPSKGSITKTIRLNKEDKEAVLRVMEIHGLSWSGAIHKMINENKYDLRPFERVCKRVGVEPEVMIREVVKGMKESADRAEGKA